jgi:cellulose synthase/poly-beta-1,6-N-acetylglucosamine synthase-like glycosyltransferase
MLVHALFLVLCWFVLSSAVLLLVGRQLGVSVFGSLALVGGIEVIGSAGAVAAGMVPAEVMPVVIISSGLGVVVIRAFPAWNPAGHAAWLFAAEAGALYMLVVAVFALLLPTSIITLLLGIVLFGLQFFGILLALSYTHELLDVVCRRYWRRPEGQPPLIARRGRPRRRSRAFSEEPPARHHPHRTPQVALHVPCHDEPPEVVERTLRALARLDYPAEAYQVFVVDNNTKDSAVWQPVAATCDELGFVFLHLEDWPGFKSGALNYALAVTPPEFEIIGVVDADYLVAPAYLRELVGYFEDPAVAFVQTPQDYRDYRPDSTFYQRACYHAYRYFFDVSMPSRNERNAIIFGGTMGLIRADTLRRIGGWDEWCITEDAEASLRLLARGYQGRFVNQSYGRGLMPLDFDALKRQRFRWCFGGIQILRKHWHALLPWSRRAQPSARWAVPGLTAAQRYHYLLGGLQWYGDALGLSFTILLVITGWFRVLGYPVQIPMLGGPVLALPLAFWVMNLLRTLWGLRATRRCTWGEAIGAAGILWGLGWVVTLASLQGLVRKRGVFLRTPKAGRASLVRALRSTIMETALGAACWGLSFVLLATAATQAFSSTSLHAGGAQRLAATGVLSWWALGMSEGGLGVLAFLQGATYLAAPVLCLLSLRTEKAAREVRRRALDSGSGEGILEHRLLVGVGSLVGVLIGLMIAAIAFPPSGAPLGRNSQQVISTLLGTPQAGATPVASPTPGGLPQTPSAGIMPTADPGASPAGTPTATPTVTPTPRPGATPTPSQPGATSTPSRPGATPTPHRL